MKVLIAGAGGQLGRYVEAAANAANHDVVALARADLDVTDLESVIESVQSELPEAVINCAAYTDVDGAEDNEPGAQAINADGAANLARAANQVGAKVIYVSTDYVFDGEKESPYVESDEVDPQSAYGRTKLAGELETANLNENHYIVRTSWLFGIGSKNFVDTMLYLAEDNDEVLVVGDQVGCPTFTGHLAHGLVELLDTSAFGVHHMAGWGECSWFDFATEIFKQAGMECRVMAATSEMVKRKAPRPAHSSLISERERPIRLPRWQEGLAEYLKLREACKQKEVQSK